MMRNYFGSCAGYMRVAQPSATDWESKHDLEEWRLTATSQGTCLSNRLRIVIAVTIISASSALRARRLQLRSARPNSSAMVATSSLP